MQFLPPTHAMQLKQGGKFHLANPRMGDGFLVTVCGKLFASQQPKPLTDLHPDEVCQKCLGPMQAIPSTV